MHKKYHEKFKILDILAVTTQAHDGIETGSAGANVGFSSVTTQAHDGIETLLKFSTPRKATRNNSSP